MTLVAQNAHDLCSEHFIKYLKHMLAVCLVSLSYCTLLHVMASTFVDCLNITKKGAHTYVSDACQRELRGKK
jgi:hypothetical protein